MKKIHLLLFVALFAACLPQKDSRRKPVALPKDFQGQADSASSGALAYSVFYTDTHLVALLTEAVANNPDLNAALQRVQGSRAAWIARRGSLFPSVTAGVSAAQRKFGLYTMDGAGNISTFMLPGEIVPIHLQDYVAGFQASWEVDFLGKLSNRKKAAYNRFLAGTEGKNFVMTELIAEVANTYYDLLANDNEAEILEETVKLQENAVNLVKAQKQAGIVNELAVNQLETQLLSTRAMLAETRQRQLENENKINFLLGRFPVPVSRNPRQLVADTSYRMKLGNPEFLVRNRPDIRQREYEMTAAGADLRAARRAFYPSLNISAAWGYQAFRTDLLFMSPESMMYTMLAGLAAPLINRSALKAELRTANATQIESVLNYRRAVLLAYAEVLNQKAAIANYRKMQDYRMQQVGIANESAEISTELFRTGKATYVEVLLSQQNALEAKLQHVTARKLRFQAQVNLYKALGGGWK